MSTYGEYCPIAAGVECFGDRWTPLILRELIIGSTGFNEIHRGLNRMSRSLLSQRLKELERRGIIERVSDGKAVQYHLTQAGRELEPVVWALGRWAMKWAFGDPDDEDLDVGWLVWRLHQQTANDKLPERRTVIQFVVSGPGGGDAWIVLDRGASTACFVDPGFDVDLVVMGDNREMHRWVLDATSYRDLYKNGHIRFVGPSRLTRAFPTWFDTTRFMQMVGGGAASRKSA